MWASLSRVIGRLPDPGREFDLAAERIQHALLDVSMPHIEGLDLGMHAEPARLVGGDYIDVFPIDDRRLFFGLGDASGKSLAAALNALMLRYLVRGLVFALGDKALPAILGHANDVVTQDLGESDHFITLVLGCVDAENGVLRVANAGHEPPLVLRRDDPNIEMITGHNIVLGVNSHVHYLAEEATLNVGDRAVIYTDGLTEASNERGELYTIERLSETFLTHRNLAAQELADTLFEAVKAYAGQNMRDDATIFVIRRTA